LMKMNTITLAFRLGTHLSKMPLKIQRHFYLLFMKCYIENAFK
jgi:hypothetical protein